MLFVFDLSSFNSVVSQRFNYQYMVIIWLCQARSICPGELPGLYKLVRGVFVRCCRVAVEMGHCKPCAKLGEMVQVPELMASAVV